MKFSGQEMIFIIPYDLHHKTLFFLTVCKSKILQDWKSHTWVEKFQMYCGIK